MTPEFARAIAFTLSKHIEGGYSHDPEDRGNWTSGKRGEGVLLGTKYGISAMRYPQLDIKSLSLSDAQNIYWRDYWCANHCDEMPGKLALAFFDMVVNQSQKDAVLCLQAALGVAQDGVIGPVTLARARTMDQSESIPNLLAERALKYTGYKQFPRYGRGWLERVVRVAMEVAVA